MEEEEYKAGGHGRGKKMFTGREGEEMVARRKRNEQVQTSAVQKNFVSDDGNGICAVQQAATSHKRLLGT